MESYNEQEPVTKWAEAERDSRKYGMLEAGVDRIISQELNPKINHSFRPQIMGVIHKFLKGQKKEAMLMTPSKPESQEPPTPSQDTSKNIPGTLESSM
ncbi:Biorientation of chromosomes in cell division protein 1-like 2 [Sciurus carolinensis]|uniref:Biorientation of chromosomes in cell division protein 1-like 2 n=1 Tax=Sciurus carolinensis TaxID=30640 RepID=A0AA41MS23_SCICA|nr:Biorientation of chromosomes in cell division protein 1-like 2 [Sciurus carolinensis]